jgi:hypothetical protein
MKCISWCDKHCIPYNRIMQNSNIFLKWINYCHATINY